MKAMNIMWDTDGDRKVLKDLPTEIEIPEDLAADYKNGDPDAEENISDYLSDETGFCHFGFRLVI